MIGREVGQSRQCGGEIYVPPFWLAFKGARIVVVVFSFRGRSSGFLLISLLDCMLWKWNFECKGLLERMGLQAHIASTSRRLCYICMHIIVHAIRRASILHPTRIRS